MLGAWRDGAEKIDQCGMLWLIGHEISDGYGLRLRIEESVTRQPYEDLDRDYTPELAARIRAANHDCEIQKSGRAFEITFQQIISYTVTNESWEVHRIS